MKRSIIYLILVILALTQFSCNDYMELLPPDGLIREEYWKNKTDVEAVLMAAYQRFADLDDKLFIYGEVRADMVADAGNQNANERNLAQGNIYSNNVLCNWQDFYKVINNCNEVIKSAEGVQDIDNTFTDFERERLVSEAYFLRSLAYFYLVRVFNEVPLVLEPSESDDAEFYLEKSSEVVILDQIVSDLENNRRAAPGGEFKTIEENKGRASKAAFDALLADIALWRFDYEAVIMHVEKIEITERYILLPGSRWFELFYPGNSIESIMEFQFNDGLGQTNGTYSLTNDNGNRYNASQTAVELLGRDFTNEFDRGEGVSIARLGEDEYLIWKYVGQSADGRSTRAGFQQNSCNWIVYRYADVLLMKAEALSQLGRYDEANDIIQLIRERAGVAPLNIPNSTIAYEDAILTERAKELCFEGKRWFDLLRMARRNDFSRKSDLIEIIVSNVPSAQKRVLAVKLTNPLGWYLPIHFNEIERNFKLVQNPYYDQ